MDTETPSTYEQRLRAAACALAQVVRREFPMVCKDPEKVAELLAIEDLLAEPSGDGNAKTVGLAGIIGESHTSDGLEG